MNNLEKFTEACLKHLQGQHNQKRHGYRYGSVQAARRSMAGTKDPAERAEYRKRAGMPEPVKRKKVEEKPDSGGAEIVRKNQLLSSLDDKAEALGMAGKTARDYKASLRTSINTIFDTVRGNADKLRQSGATSVDMDVQVRTALGNQMQKNWGSRKPQDFMVVRDGRKAIMNIPDLLDSIANTMSGMLKRELGIGDILKPKTPEKPKTDYDSLVSKITASGKKMQSKFPGKDIYGKAFGKGQKIIYSQYGIVLDE